MNSMDVANEVTASARDLTQLVQGRASALEVSVRFFHRMDEAMRELQVLATNIVLSKSNRKPLIRIDRSRTRKNRVLSWSDSMLAHS